MTVLKARVAGAWQTIGGATFGPAGGVTGDWLQKASATDYDATWTSTPLRLNLTSSAVLSLSQNNHALQIGAAATANVIFTTNAIQARNNGNNAPLYLNNLGGEVWVGDGTTNSKLYVGNDAYLADANQSHSMQLASATDSTQGKLFVGNTAFIYGSSTTVQIAGGAATSGYFDVNTHYFRTGAGATKMTLDASSNLTLAGNTIYFGNNNAYLTWNGANTTVMYSSNVMQFNGNQMYFLNTPSNAWLFQHNGTTLRQLAGGYTHNNVGYAFTHDSDTDTGLYYDGAEQICLISGGERKLCTTAGASYAKYSGFTTSNKNWAACPLVIQNQGAAAGVTLSGISANPANGGIAPILLCNPAAGEVWGCQNNPNTAWIPIVASAFNIGSTERIKTNIRHLNDREVLDKVRLVKMIKYLEKIRPQQIDQDEEGNFLTVGNHDHDCDIDPCVGTRDNPCCIALNDKERLGVSAEELWEILPEVVMLGPDRKPETISIGQIATLALAGLAAALRRIEALEEFVQLEEAEAA